MNEKIQSKSRDKDHSLNWEQCINCEYLKHMINSAGYTTLLFSPQNGSSSQSWSNYCPVRRQQGRLRRRCPVRRPRSAAPVTQSSLASWWGCGEPPAGLRSSPLHRPRAQHPPRPLHRPRPEPPHPDNMSQIITKWVPASINSNSKATVQIKLHLRAINSVHILCPTQHNMSFWRCSSGQPSIVH